MAVPFDIKYYICITGVYTSICEEHENIQDIYVIASLVLWFILSIIAVKLCWNTFGVPKDAITPPLNQKFLYFSYLLLCITRVITFICAFCHINKDHAKYTTPYVISDAFTVTVQVLIFNIIFYNWSATTNRVKYKTFHVWWLKYKRILWSLSLVVVLSVYVGLRLFLDHALLQHWIIFQSLFILSLTIPSILFWVTLTQLKAMLSSTIDEMSHSPGDDPFHSTTTSSSNATRLHMQHDFSQSRYFMASPSGMSSHAPSSLGPFTRLDSDFSLLVGNNHNNNNQRGSTLQHHNHNDRHHNRASTHELLNSAQNQSESGQYQHTEEHSPPINKARVTVLQCLSRLTWIYAAIYVFYLTGSCLSLYVYGRYFYLISQGIYVIFLFYYQPEKVLLLDATQPGDEDHPHHNNDLQGSREYDASSRDTMIDRDDGVYLPPNHYRTSAMNHNNNNNNNNTSNNTSSNNNDNNNSTNNNDNNNTSNNTTSALNAATQNIQQRYQQHQYGSYQTSSNPTMIPTTPNLNSNNTNQNTYPIGQSPSMNMNANGQNTFNKMHHHHPNQQNHRTSGVMLLSGQSPITAGVGASLVESYLASQTSTSLRSSQGSLGGLNDQSLSYTNSILNNSMSNNNFSNNTNSTNNPNVIPKSPTQPVNISTNAHNTNTSNNNNNNINNTNTSFNEQTSSLQTTTPIATNAFSYYQMNPQSLGANTNPLLMGQQYQQQAQNKQNINVNNNNNPNPSTTNNNNTAKSSQIPSSPRREIQQPHQGQGQHSFQSPLLSQQSQFASLPRSSNNNPSMVPTSPPRQPLQQQQQHQQQQLQPHQQIPQQQPQQQQKPGVSAFQVYSTQQQQRQPGSQVTNPGLTKSNSGLGNTNNTPQLSQPQPIPLPTTSSFQNAMTQNAFNVSNKNKVTSSPGLGPSQPSSFTPGLVGSLPPLGPSSSSVGGGSNVPKGVNKKGGRKK